MLFRSALTNSESIFNGIIMIILDVGIGYDLCGLDFKKKKNYKYFEMSFSCFGLFGVWGMTSHVTGKFLSIPKVRKNCVFSSHIYGESHYKFNE